MTTTASPAARLTALVVPPPHVVAADGRVLASRILTCRAGMLYSPVHGTPWPTRIQRAHEWSDSALVRGQCGLCAAVYQPDVRPALGCYVAAHVLCGGRIAFASRGLRAEEMELAWLTVLDRELVRPLRQRYGVPVRVRTTRRPVSRGRPGLRWAVLNANGTTLVHCYQRGIPDLRIESWQLDGTILVEHYRCGQPHGSWELHRPDGTVAIWGYEAQTGQRACGGGQTHHHDPQ